ncbi:MAG: hypothetical protein QXG01_07430 [Candidatus Bathyarchaeia archaeon]
MESLAIIIQTGRGILGIEELLGNAYGARHTCLDIPLPPDRPNRHFQNTETSWL